MAQKRLQEDFLSAYSERGDCFPNLLARSTYLSKYSRDNEDWTGTIRRVVDGNCDLDPNVSEKERQLLFHTFWTMQALPPGRSLWVGGLDRIPAEARYNCFAGETKFFSNGRLVELQAVVGQTVDVRCADKKWRPAEVKNFGKQKLFKYVFRAPGHSSFELSYDVTENHRWITENRGEVTDLRVGDTVRITPDVITDENSAVFREGFVHGLVFGDGAFIGDERYNLRLCGEKRKHLNVVEKSYTTSHSFPPSFDGDPIVQIKNAVLLKHVPSEDMPFSYQAGFLAGWLATDGSFRKTGVGGNRLTSTDHAALSWAIERAPFLGYCVTGDCVDRSTETNYGKHGELVRVLTFTKEPTLYTVRQKIDEGREEDVFCVTEPVTRTFTIEGGVVTGNCWYTTLYDYVDWTWVANMLMLGGGVGVGLSETSNLPIVAREPARLVILCDATHENVTEVKPDNSAIGRLSPITMLGDSREGWVYGLERVLDCAFHGIDLTLDVSAIRPRGKPIKTFGGVACGPGPLVDMLRATWNVVRKAAGRKLSSVEALDITNHIGKCIKSGNVRRSALIALGHPHDQEFRDAKKDFDAVLSHRHTSNNSICFQKFSEFEKFDWRGLVEDNLKYGEPGILNLALGRRTDPGAMGVNPCGEQLLHDREACNLAEVFPANFDGSVEPNLIFELVARYCLRQRLTPLTLDSRAGEVGKKNMRVGVGLGGVCDFDWNEDLVRGWFKAVRRACDAYASDLGVARPITTTTVKPSGTISLLCGSSPGLHAPFAPYYIRRTRHAINDPMTAALKEAGVPWEMDKYDSKGNTLCFAFPMKAKHTRVTTKTETVRDQFDRQLKIQNSWADNAVSCTINFNHDQPEELAELLAEYAPQLKSTSCLPRFHGYEQAPYEQIEQSMFEEMSKGINFNAKLTKGEFDSMEGCEASGACPIR